MASTASDRNLKENIRKITNSLNLIDKISGVYFDWTDDYIESHGGEDEYFLRKNDVGVIAQEINDILPQAVSQREDGTLAVSYDKIIPLLIECIKELSERIK